MVFLFESLASARRLYGKELADKCKQIDPSDTFKYTEWLCKMVDTGHSESDLSSLIQTWDEYLQKNQIPEEKRNIDALTYRDVVSILDSLEGSVSRTQQKKQSLTEATLVFENEDWKVVVPHTVNASKIYGYATKWCTTGDKDNEFLHYSMKGRKLYYILPQEEENMTTSKIAVIVQPLHNDGTLEFRDWEDTKITVEDFKEATGDSIPLNLFEPYTEMERTKVLVSSLKAACKVVDGKLVFTTRKDPLDLKQLLLLRMPVKIDKCLANFEIQFNLLKSMENFPTKIDGTMNVSGNPDIKSFKGAPEKISGWIYAGGTGISESDWKEYARKVGSPGVYF